MSRLRCNRCHRDMPGTSYYDGSCECGGLVEYAPSEPRIYRIIRFRFKGTNRTTRTGLTLAEAQAHCSREDTHGPGWFDGYDYMRGCAPKDGD